METPFVAGRMCIAMCTLVMHWQEALPFLSQRVTGFLVNRFVSTLPLYTCTLKGIKVAQHPRTRSFILQVLEDSAMVKRSSDRETAGWEAEWRQLSKLIEADRQLQAAHLLLLLVIHMSLYFPLSAVCCGEGHSDDPHAGKVHGQSAFKRNRKWRHVRRYF